LGYQEELLLLFSTSVGLLLSVGLLSKEIDSFEFDYTFISNAVTFNFFVLHRLDFEVTIAEAWRLLLMWPEMNRSNELLLIEFPFPTTRLSCLLKDRLRLVQTHHNYI
jgi:hypothetical protein